MGGPSLTVFAPSPLLTITVEGAGTRREEIHLHAGGQGFWVARMAALLGTNVSMCCALGGESGAVLRGLIARESVEVLSVDCAAANGVYIHARRGGVREQFARTEGKRLSRHETDELYGLALSAALDADVALLTGVDPPTVLESEVYRRLAGDLRSNGVAVIADLAGSPLKAALAGGVDLLKISENEILGEAPPGSAGVEDLLEAMDRLQRSGAQTVLVSRAEEPALVLDGSSGTYLELIGPRVESLEPRGTGDSMFAALGASLASGQPLETALGMAMAAGCLNATRHGLGTGTRQQIEKLSRHIKIEQLTGARGGWGPDRQCSPRGAGRGLTLAGCSRLHRSSPRSRSRAVRAKPDRSCGLARMHVDRQMRDARVTRTCDSQGVLDDRGRAEHHRAQRRKGAHLVEGGGQGAGR